MHIENVRLINRPPEAEHELLEDDLLVTDGVFHVVMNGLLEGMLGTSNPAKFTNVHRAYLVDAAVRDDPTKVEHAKWRTIRRRALARHVLASSRVTANQVGHMYLTTDAYLWVYLGRADIVDDQLRGMRGHAYLDVSVVDVQTLGEQMDIGSREFIDHCMYLNDYAVNGDGHLVRIADGAAPRRLCIHVFKSPRRLVLDLGRELTVPDQLTATMVCSHPHFKAPDGREPGVVDYTPWMNDQGEVEHTVTLFRR